MRGFRANVLALEGDPACRDSVRAGDRAQESGLACTVGADKRDRLTFLDAEANAMYGLSWP
jgi:hypothetical protein